MSFGICRPCLESWSGRHRSTSRESPAESSQSNHWSAGTNICGKIKCTGHANLASKTVGGGFYVSFQN